ncbi:hypothetical protein HK405_014272, partial [Cladochytrium tenue]
GRELTLGARTIITVTLSRGGDDTAGNVVMSVEVAAGFGQLSQSPSQDGVRRTGHQWRSQLGAQGFSDARAESLLGASAGGVTTSWTAPSVVVVDERVLGELARRVLTEALQQQLGEEEAGEDVNGGGDGSDGVYAGERAALL